MKNSILFSNANKAIVCAFNLKYKPHKWHKIDKFHKAVMFLRGFGKENILSRLKALENDEYIPKDILSAILLHYYHRM